MRHRSARLAPTLLATAVAGLLAATTVAGAAVAGGTASPSRAHQAQTTVPLAGTAAGATGEVHLLGTPIGACATCFVEPRDQGSIVIPTLPVAP
ncbi:hypothetical protein BDK92_4828 [Micromonospora pisi]|uniref:Uncharacterized protein n=1 Tax=Micromonospora pisi TaxID=589240 RepID=A0A495JP92_9ACTN|nr:hypothetical protein [Micromonospora pisi]RKR90455.1 hypothetical protein BDK92_4828 [Micromonospora pisi]